jgi:hypothetical protein
LSVIADDLFIASALLQHGACPNVSYDSVSPLQVAALNRSVAMCHLLVSQGADVNHMDRTRTSALFAAVENDCFDLTMILLQKGANPNLVNREGVYPLYIAIRGNNIPLFELILEHGADVNMTHRGVTSVYMAIYLNHTYMAVTLLDAGARMSGAMSTIVLRMAVYHQNYAVCKRLVVQADVNSTDVMGETPLSICMGAPAPSLDIVILLLRCGSVFVTTFVKDIRYYAAWALQCYNDEFLFHVWASLPTVGARTRVVENDDLGRLILSFIVHASPVRNFVWYVMGNI